jgi:RimJ/RimL family protein N-acetyltransferase
MKSLSPEERERLRSWFLPDRPGPLVGLHVLETGHGAIFADRWPDPQAILAKSGSNLALHGQAAAIKPEELAELGAGFVAAPDEFFPLLQEAFPGLEVWERVILELEGEPVLRKPGEAEIRRLGSSDVAQLRNLSPGSSWISNTWGSPAACAEGGRAWGAFIDGRLASVAVSFFVGVRYEDLGVVTEDGFRGQGLSAACAGELLIDIRQRGRMGSWSTSPDNLASLRVAEKLGFRFVRSDRLYAAGVSIPRPAE